MNQEASPVLETDVTFSLKSQAHICKEIKLEARKFEQSRLIMCRHIYRTKKNYTAICQNSIKKDIGQIALKPRVLSNLHFDSCSPHMKVHFCSFTLKWSSEVATTFRNEAWMVKEETTQII